MKNETSGSCLDNARLTELISQHELPLRKSVGKTTQGAILDGTRAHKPMRVLRVALPLPGLVGALPDRSNIALYDLKRLHFV